ncbi:hypothetical protein ATANTOWER_024298 [Ataeniobius toweri]|uniref:Cytochrome c biogenesis B n=1 Tax=Ataeniobius toweri TaxID=208326 RepID=A0ABU7ARC1_9TELE|nr:hypothetical protein [Ataeniobius toweri]
MKISGCIKRIQICFHHTSEIWLFHRFLTEHFVLRLQVYWWYYSAILHYLLLFQLLTLFSLFSLPRSYTWLDSVSTCDTFLEGAIIQASAANNLMNAHLLPIIHLALSFSVFPIFLLGIATD